MYAYDLHNHTTASDGVYAPAELVRLAARLGMRGLAITDHDTTDGLAEATAEAKSQGIRLICGVELSSEQAADPDGPEQKVHMLGLFVDYNSPNFQDYLRESQQLRFRRGELMLAKLAELGMPLDKDGSLLAGFAKRGAVSRGMLGRKMVEAGYAADTDEAFERWLGVGRPAYVPRRKLAAVEAIRLIHEAGGLAVMAHPIQSGDDRLIGLLAAAGLDGLECCHPDQPGLLEQHYRELAAKYQLRISGGSDCHSKGLGEWGLSPEEFRRLAEARPV